MFYNPKATAATNVFNKIKQNRIKY